MGTGIANARTVQWGQSTPAMQAIASVLNRGRTSSGTRRRRAKTKRVATKKKRARVVGRSRKKSRLVKGSAAAKRYMARIRRMRKRK